MLEALLMRSSYPQPLKVLYGGFSICSNLCAHRACTISFSSSISPEAGTVAVYQTYLKPQGWRECFTGFSTELFYELRALVPQPEVSLMDTSIRKPDQSQVN